MKQESNDWLAPLMGQLVIAAGWTEHQLGELTVLLSPNSIDDDLAGWGQSGERLMKWLRRADDTTGTVPALLQDYEEIAEWRNRFIHSGWVQANAMATAWYVPIAKSDPTHLRSFAVTPVQLRELVERWKRLERAVENAVGLVMGISGSVDPAGDEVGVPNCPIDLVSLVRVAPTTEGDDAQWVCRLCGHVRA